MWASVAAAIAGAAVTTGGSALLNSGSRGGSGGSGGLVQRIPGQTTAGSYTPPQGGFATYNYIPTGAEQIDPALIAQILDLNNMNSGAAGTASPINQQLLQSIMGNPYLAGMQGAAGQAGTMAGGQSQQLMQLQQMLSGGMNPLMQGSQALSGMTGPGVWNSSTPNAAPVWSSAFDLMGTYGNMLNQSQQNPYAQNMISGANTIGQSMQRTGANIQGTAEGALEGAADVTNKLLANPYTGQAQAGANTAGQQMQGAAGMYGQAGANQFGTGQTLTNAAMGGLPALSQVLNTSFDPQSALYEQTRQKTMDQIGSTLARTGTTDSGTGAKFLSDALSNFNIDWQNQQLGRQQSGLQSYGQGLQNISGGATTGANMQTGGAGAAQTGAETYGRGAMLPYQTYQGMGATDLGTLGQLGALSQLTAGTANTTGNMQLGGNAAGYNAYIGDLQSQLGFADAYKGGSQNLASAFSGINSAMGNNLGTQGNILGQMGNLSGQIGNLGQGAVNMQNMSGQLPYGAYMQGYGDQFAGLSNYLNGQTGMNNLYSSGISPMQNYLSSVMDGARNAAGAASGAQNRTTDQNATAMAPFMPAIDAFGNAIGNWAGNQFSGGGSGYGSVYNNNSYGYRPYTPTTPTPIRYSY